MRLLLAILIAVGGAALLWYLIGDSGGEAPGGADLRVTGGDDPTSPSGGEDMLTAKGREPTPVTRVEEFPDDLMAFFETGEGSLLDDAEFGARILRFEFDPARPHRRLTGEDILRSLSEMPGIGKPFHFLKKSDLERFRKHHFQAVAEPRMDAASIISLCPVIGYRAVEYEGEYYMVPIPGQFVEESAPMEGTASDKRTKSEKERDERAMRGGG